MTKTNCSVLEPVPVEDEKGELRSSQDVEFRRGAECRKPHVVWNTEIRSYLSIHQTASMLSHLSHSAIWPVEVVRVTSSPSRAKGKEDEHLPSHYGVAFVDLSALLYPGATSVTGAYHIKPYNDIILADTTQGCHWKSIMDLLYVPKLIPGSIHLVQGTILSSNNIGDKKNVAQPGSKRASAVMRTSAVSIISQETASTGE